MIKITNYSECDTDYLKAVRGCKTIDELKTIVTEYREIADDAYQAVQKMDDTLFVQFCMGRNRLKPSLKWMEMYGVILIPAKILEIGMMATHFHVPFGAMYLRMKDLKKVRP